MSLTASYKKHVSEFITPGGTSRGVLTYKDSYIIEVFDDLNPKIKGVGEVSVINKLSIDAVDELEEMVDFVCRNINQIKAHLDTVLINFPAIRFGFEMALLDLQNGGKQIYFPSKFTSEEASITINGLIWMGDISYMISQIKEKIADGFGCLKLKIGANELTDELDLLKQIRDEFKASQLEIRLDANGAFEPKNALERLEQFSKYDIHSIEQPIKQGQWHEMAKLCSSSPIKIALDEELIGINNRVAQREMLRYIKPHYIILKPSLVGGFRASNEWIDIAQTLNIDYWITSALESNIGLNAISQWCFTKGVDMPQGLGTGKLFSNNFESPLYIKGDQLYHKCKL